VCKYTFLSIVINHLQYHPHRNLNPPKLIYISPILDMSSTNITSIITSITSMVSSSTPTSSRGGFGTGNAGWGLQEPRPNHPGSMGSINGNHPSSGNGASMPAWAIVILVIVFGFMFAGLGYLFWLTFKPTMSKKEREEARREIDLERASLEAEAKWQRSLKQAEAEALERRMKQKGEEIEMKEKKSSKVRDDEGEKVVVGTLGKRDNKV
jgi:hypothetical protein